MRVYLAAPVRAPRGDVEAYRTMRRVVQEMGHELVLAHVAEDDPAAGEARAGLNDARIFQRDVDALNGSDLLVADVSRPSLGVGWEIAYFLARGRLVIACCHKDARGTLSAMITGNPSPWQQLVVYADADDLARQLRELV